MWEDEDVGGRGCGRTRMWEDDDVVGLLCEGLRRDVELR